ncbi:hypothetical protein LIER_35000 [Lithospermum erythrorhizon]|uniref:Uncharacterized protein n=1 Tax=Lithospermum erythrorhizon TaxID=34254 RepID=A0AAV3NHU1_LITER
MNVRTVGSAPKEVGEDLVNFIKGGEWKFVDSHRQDDSFCILSSDCVGKFLSHQDIILSSSTMDKPILEAREKGVEGEREVEVIDLGGSEMGGDVLNGSEFFLIFIGGKCVKIFEEVSAMRLMSSSEERSKPFSMTIFKIELIFVLYLT